MIDSGNYSESWDEASQLFKNAVTKELWLDKIRAVRAHRGKVQSRKLKSATYSKTLRGAPDGEYVVIKYDTIFENEGSAVKTITSMLDKDGKWRVSPITVFKENQSNVMSFLCFGQSVVFTLKEWTGAITNTTSFAPASPRAPSGRFR